MLVIGIVLSIVFIILGIWMIFNPEMFWAFDHMFSVENGEPTEMAIIFLRIRGVLIGGILAGYLFSRYKKNVFL